jgi:formate hydrogenlyase subunit 3/multisubunit Na+/H+ antiporter MnhD subunit
MNTLKRGDKLPALVKLSLFISSYSPLFIIIILKQVDQNKEYLSFGGVNCISIKLLFTKFGISIFLTIASIIGLAGLYFFIKNMKKITEDNGDSFVITRIENKNTESMGYVATYLLPFVFQDYSSLFEIIEVFLLLTVMYIIYTHSTLIVVNPVLNVLRYSLYNIEYYNNKSTNKSTETIRDGIFIVNCHYLEKEDTLLAKKLKANLFYGIISEIPDE